MGFLYFLIGLLLLIALILVIPLRILIEYNGEPYIKAKYTFFTFDIFPLKEETEPAQKKEKQPKKTAKAKKAKPKEKKPATMQDILWYIEFAKQLMPHSRKALGFITRHITIDKLVLQITVSGDDAAEAGMNYGKMGAAVYTALALAQNIFRVKPPKKINLQPDFTGGSSEIQFSVRISLALWAAVFATLRLGIKFLPFLTKKSKQPKEATV